MSSLLAALFSAIACDGPCVRFLSSDFDLRLAFASHTVSPDVYSGADNPGQLRVDGTGRLDSQNRLFCNATGCVRACPLGLSTKLCDHMCTPQCSRHCGEKPSGH